MNWTGGSRNRLVMKNDAKKQKEYFERRKMQQRLRKMGLTLPTTPGSTSSSSMDLVTLFIVNQIAAKKENKDPPKVAVLGSCKGRSQYKRNAPLVLPMSPCSPSQLDFVESQPQYSVQATGKNKHVIPRGFRCRQLSPVLESAFSDNSASDYLPPITDPLSPFSSTSSASSGQGMFPQLNPQQRSQMRTQLPPHCSPRPWDTSGLEQTKFQPFSQPRGMTDSVPWSYGSNTTLYQLETPTAANVLFGSSEPDNTDNRNHARQEVTFSLDQPEDREQMLDFTFNQSETESQIEGDVFRGFSTEESEAASPFGRVASKIHLKDETPVKSSTPQTVPDSQCMRVELSNCTDTNFSFLEHNNGPMNGCNCSPSYSCSGGYLSSDSNDEEEYCQPSHQAASSYVDQACSVDKPNPNRSLQENPNQSHTQPKLLTPVLKPQISGSNNQQMGSHVAQLNSHQALAETLSSQLCKCKKTPTETRDAGTQTADNPTAETCDASTQYSFVGDTATKVTGSNLCLPPVDVSVQHTATGRQTDTAAESDTHTPSPGEVSSRGKYTPWNKKKSRADSLSGSSFINTFTADNSDRKFILQRPINPFQDALSKTKQRNERGQEENGCLMKDPSSEVREEVLAATEVSRHSEEAATLQEIANILLLLKQREK
ncbi:uncharacterized protein redic1 isoform X2 [Sparus aurata]|uniref:uncharacterized protein redic1 isoform X2 n=1 Tax=Sparus aurata TaxID=8175 RepID=UPI0011C132A9|nr:uncharacterized protein C12orf40 homolog isoform X2 [Sparus aurata]